MQEIVAILNDIEAALPEVPREELTAVSDSWRQIITAVHDDVTLDANSIGLIRAAVNASPFLIGQGFGELLNHSVSRFGNQPQPTGKGPEKGLPPIHNEVIRIGQKIQLLLR